MLFFTWPFAIFFCFFYPTFLLVRNKVRLRNAVLVVAALTFYGWWDVRFLTLLAFTVGLDYLSALGVTGRQLKPWHLVRSCGFLVAVGLIALIGNRFSQTALLTLPVFAALALYGGLFLAINAIGSEVSRRKTWLYASIVINLAVLCFFKYFNFFGDSLNQVFAASGVQLGFVALNIILPLGISFHTFQSIGRTIDVSRGKLEPSEDFLEFATFLTYFPQILAGPIERANHMLPQFRTPQPITMALVRSGCLLFLWGLFKKQVIADNLAPLANLVFANPDAHTSGELLVGVLAFSFQIYGDFSGYTDMARGLARLMGFDLRLNFALPYFARTPSEFWRRWHISLSEWLRDYLYISLGGNRGGRWKMYRNLMLTMLLGGLWHGAAWTFVIWGFLHGLIQVVYRAVGFDDWLSARSGQRHGWFWNLAAWMMLMPLIALTWIYFRAESVVQGNAIVLGMLRLDRLGAGAWSTLAFYALPLFCLEAVMRINDGRIAFARLPFIVRYTLVVVLILAILALSASSGQDFIYFDF